MQGETARHLGQQIGEGARILERAFVRPARIAEIDSDEHRAPCALDEGMSHRLVAVKMDHHIVAAVFGVPAMERYNHLAHPDAQPTRVRAEAIFWHITSVVSARAKTRC